MMFQYNWYELFILCVLVTSVGDCVIVGYRRQSDDVYYEVLIFAVSKLKIRPRAATIDNFTMQTFQSLTKGSSGFYAA
jgi:hypothetical protein